MNKKIILLINLGSPNSTNTNDVRRYLNEFLSDERVLDIPYIFRKLLLNLIILPFRPSKTAKKYKTVLINNRMPLILFSENVQNKLSKISKYPVELAMRYGNPSIKNTLISIKEKYKNLTEIIVVPLYPHYALSSFETAFIKFETEFKKLKFNNVNYKIIKPFYKNEAYISSLAESIKPYLNNFDYLLFSYHGIPERHVKLTDPNKNHCLKIENCCNIDNETHKYCYRHQVYKTTELVIKKLNLDNSKYGVSFQSRFLNDPWLTPYTTKFISELPQKGIKNLLVVCPAFLCDCLETLQEIGLEETENFIQNGGHNLKLIPCLNDQENWIKNFNKIISEISE